MSGGESELFKVEWLSWKGGKLPVTGRMQGYVCLDNHLLELSFNRFVGGGGDGK